jgi:hypothetical protein
MATRLSELIPQTLNLASSAPLADILTEQEKQSAIDYAIHRAKVRYVVSMAEKGISGKKVSDKVEKIDWMQRINVEELLATCNRNKHREIEQEQLAAKRKQDERQRIEDLKAKCDAGYFFRMIKDFFITNYGRFDFDATNEHYIKSVCFFLSNDKRFEADLSHSFSRGLFIQGTAGLGKTKVLEAVSRNPLYKINIISMISVAEAVKEQGNFELNTNQLILLDDVGSEQETVNHYGTKINWFKDFIEKYYLQKKSYAGLLITTNCTGDEIEAKYGYRVRSRIREMFNQITLTGVDKRR